MTREPGNLLPVMVMHARVGRGVPKCRESRIGLPHQGRMADCNGKRADGWGIRRRKYYRVKFSRLSAFYADARARVVIRRATLVAFERDLAQLACVAFFRRGRTGIGPNGAK